MNGPGAVETEMDQALNAWRRRALQVLLASSCALTLAPLAAALAGWGIELSGPVRVAALCLYAVLAGLMLWRNGSLRIRAGLFLGLLATAGVMRLGVGGMAGSGRITLLMLPLLALVLLGPRAGWSTAALTAGLFAGAGVLMHTGFPAGAGGVDAPPVFWGMQGMYWLIILLALMILFARFHALQRRTMRAEWEARRQLEAETADRRRLEAEMGRIGEEERRRLGAELHDGLCQHLTAALLNCSVLEQRQRATSAADAVELAQLRVALEEAIGMAYDVAKGLCPMEVEPDALLPALAHLCRETRERHGLDCRLQADPDLTVRDPELALHLYRIAREAVANAVKHARCSRITVALERAAGELTLRVVDDGSETVPGAVPAAGLGLGILKHRAHLIGGTLHVAGGPEGGMEVVCRVPQPEISA